MRWSLIALGILISHPLSAAHKEAFHMSLDAEAQDLIDGYVKKFQPLDLKLRRAWFRYTSTGDKKASKEQAKMEFAIRTLKSDSARFEKLKKLYAERKSFQNPSVRRQIEILYRSHLPNQVAPKKLQKLTALEQSIQEAFNDYRPLVDGKKLSPVEVSHLFEESTDSLKLEKVWKAYHLVGQLIERYYRELVELRNEIARDLGYKSALELHAFAQEFDLDMLKSFYAEIKRATDAPFRRLKERAIDPKVARRFGISVRELRPWHYQDPFFQEAPAALFEKVDFDAFYAKSDANDAVQKTVAFYKSFGIDIQEIVARSSLFPKEGKNPHAVAWFLDPRTPGTSLMSMNLPHPPEAPKASEVSTLVHELSHDVNYEAILQNSALPYLLREPTMLTEAVAMLFEHQTRTKEWLESFGASHEDAAKAVKAFEEIDYVDQLVFIRWASTIFCFETKFYEDPAQDIGDLWWSCKGEHQLEPRPPGWKNPDALAKYHIANIHPFQYSNYAIGRIANVQFAKLLASKVGASPRGASYFGKTDLGAWLMKDFLAAGELYRWDDFIKQTTGEPLSIKAWKGFYLQ